MMKRNSSKVLYPAVSMLIGAVIFAVTTILCSLLTDNWLFAGLLLPSAICIVLFGLLVHITLKRIGIIVAVTSLAYLVLFLLAYAIGEFGGALWGEAAGNTIMHIAVVVEGVIFGGVLGRVFYGKQSAPIFMVTFGVVFLLVLILTFNGTFMNWLTNISGMFGQWKLYHPEEGWIIYDKVNPNSLLISTGIGAALGLSIGLYNRKSG